jgi:hypothetical protein
MVTLQIGGLLATPANVLLTEQQLYRLLNEIHEGQDPRILRICKLLQP